MYKANIFRLFFIDKKLLKIITQTNLEESETKQSDYQFLAIIGYNHVRDYILKMVYKFYYIIKNWHERLLESFFFLIIILKEQFFQIFWMFHLYNVSDLSQTTQTF